MRKEVIIMGEVLERTYEIGYFHDFYSAKLVQNFKEYREITRSSKINTSLKIGDHIYLNEENDIYSINKIATNTDGNILYFIDKVVEVLDTEDIEAAKQSTLESVKKFNKMRKEAFEEHKQAKMIEKEVSKMDRFWNWGRNKQGSYK